MPQTWLRWFLTALASALLLVQPAAATEEMRGHLVSAQWLQGNRGATDLLLLDASFAQMHAAKHIPGVVNADLFSFGVRGASAAAIEQRLQSWGINPRRRIVIYDQGGDMMATRRFFDLYRIAP